MEQQWPTKTPRSTNKVHLTKYIRESQRQDELEMASNFSISE